MPQPRPRKPADIPQVAASRLSTLPVLDGQLSEWPAERAVTMAQAPLHDYKPKVPSRFWVAHDDTYLYFAVENPVTNAAQLSREGGTWGQNDGLEFCFQSVVGGKLNGPIYVLRAYPSGKVSSEAEAGASLAQAQKLLQGSQVVTSVGADKWCAEGRLAWSAIGASPAKLDKLLLNVGVLKTAQSEWVVWVGAYAQNWVVSEAGELSLAQ